MKRKNKIKRKNKSIILKLLLYIIIILLFSVFLLDFSNDKNKTIFGYTARIVVTGSMEPSIKVNSLNIVKKCDINDICENDIICFNYGSDIIHRVIEVVNNDSGETVLHTKGDANDNADSIEINSDILIGKVIYTFNGLSSLISKYYTSPGEIDIALLIKNIIILCIVASIIIVFLYWCINSIIIIIKSLRFKEEFSDQIDKYIKDIDDLILYREMLVSLKNYETENKAETRMQYIFNQISKTKAEMEIHNIHRVVKEFKKSVNHCIFLSKLGLLLDEEDNEDKKSIRSIREHCNIDLKDNNKDNAD